MTSALRVLTGNGTPPGLVVLARGTRSGEVRVPKSGQMRVILNVHGGQKGLARVIEGLVQRNERAIAEGKAPAFVSGERRFDNKAGAWRDAPMAKKDDYVSGRTAAAWHAATLRSQGTRAIVGFRDGLPTVYQIADNGDILLVKVYGGPPVTASFGKSDARLGETEGRSDERMLVTIDDGAALPVREINTAIARHNAIRIREKNLPPLYRSGVKYKTEGSPELWWDAEEILAHGHDDCEGLAAYRAGELMNRGYDAQVYTRLIQQPSAAMGGSGKGGSRLFHAVTAVFDENGEFARDPDGVAMVDDPSARLGMGRPPWYIEFAKKMRAKKRDL